MKITKFLWLKYFISVLLKRKREREKERANDNKIFLMIKTFY